MRRLQALFLLFAFVAASALRLHCEHPCAPVVEAKASAFLGAQASTDCHGSSAAPVNVVDGHDCSKHAVTALPAVPGVKETLSEYRFAGTSVIADAIGDPSARAIVVVHSRHSHRAGPPISLFPPLRI